MHAEQAHLAEFARHLLGEDPLLEPAFDARQHASADEVAHRVPDQALLLAEQGVDLEEVQGVEPARGLRRRFGGGAHQAIKRSPRARKLGASSCNDWAWLRSKCRFGAKAGS